MTEPTGSPDPEPREEPFGHGPEGEPAGPSMRPTAPDRDTLMAILAYVPVLCLLPLLQEDADEDLRRHARQGVVLMLVELALLLLLIPEVTRTLLGLGLAVCVIFAVVGAWNAWQGRFWRIPYIAEIAERQKQGGPSQDTSEDL